MKYAEYFGAKRRLSLKNENIRYDIGIIPGFVVRGDRQRIGWQGLPETGSRPTGGRSGYREAPETLPASC